MVRTFNTTPDSSPAAQNMSLSTPIDTSELLSQETGGSEDQSQPQPQQRAKAKSLLNTLMSMPPPESVSPKKTFANASGSSFVSTGPVDDGEEEDGADESQDQQGQLHVKRRLKPQKPKTRTNGREKSRGSRRLQLATRPSSSSSLIARNTLPKRLSVKQRTKEAKKQLDRISKQGLKKIKSLSHTEDPSKKKRRFKPGTRALMDIRKYQKGTEPLIKFAPFSRLVRDIADDFGGHKRFEASAINALREAVESAIVPVFQATNIVALNSGRKTIKPRDMRVAGCLLGVQRVPGMQTLYPSHAQNLFA